MLLTMTDEQVMNTSDSDGFITKYCNMSMEFCNISLNDDNSSLLGNQSEPKLDSLTNIPAIRILCYCLYIVIFVVGLCGNVIVCYVVFRNKAMRTVTNLFIVNLALSDIMLCFFATFFTPIYIFMQKWILGATLCHLIPYAQGVSVYISSFTLMGIAIDRYFAVSHPFDTHLSVKRCFLIILVIWLLSGLFTIPFGLYMSIVTSKKENEFCVESWPSDSFKQICVVTTTIIQYVIPFLVITFCYVRIFYKLRYRARHKPGATSQERINEELKRSARVNRMLIAMVVVFGLSWLPINVFNIVIDFYPPAKNWREVHSTFISTHILAMSSSCYNPILYAWLNENFKQEFQSVLYSLKSLKICKYFESPSTSEPKEQQQDELQPVDVQPNELELPLPNEEINSAKDNRETESVSLKKIESHENNKVNITEV